MSLIQLQNSVIKGVLKLKLIFQFAMGIVLLFGLTGCSCIREYSLTGRLWENGEMTSFSEPAANPRLALFKATNRPDVLVQYDAFSEQHASVTRRSYYLFENHSRVTSRRQPKWAKPPFNPVMQPIPILQSHEPVTNQPASFAVTIRDGRDFFLHQPDKPVEEFSLPVYAETHGTTTRIILTPLAVTGDAVMVAAGMAVIGFFLWAESGAPVR